MPATLDQQPDDLTDFENSIFEWFSRLSASRLGGNPLLISEISAFWDVFDIGYDQSYFVQVMLDLDWKHNEVVIELNTPVEKPGRPKT